MITPDQKSIFIFGGDKSWNSADWTDSDDRVRGGKSQSYLKYTSDSAEFYGNLDIDTLGGAGFASQRTTGDDNTWNLKDYDGIRMVVTKSDSKRYTLTLKDELLPRDLETGREQSTVSWEYDFTIDDKDKSGADQAEHLVWVPWNALKPTYRGKVKKDAKPLDLGSVKRFSLLMRSFFGDQKGDFSITIKSISACKLGKKETDRSSPATISSEFPYPYRDDESRMSYGGIEEKVFPSTDPTVRPFSWIRNAIMKCIGRR